MKHRGNSKIKYEHHLIPRLREYLERLELEPTIKSIIPGRISRTKTHQQFKFVAKQQTPTGTKYIAYSGSEVQEVFVVK